MSYVEAANSIKSTADVLKSSVDKIDSSAFDSIWKGQAHDALTSKLTDSLSKIKKQQISVNRFTNAIEKIDKYKENKENIKSLRIEYDNIVDTKDNIEANRMRRMQLKNKIHNLEYLNKTLKNVIVSALNSISSVSSEYDVINYDSSQNEGYKEYIVDLYDFMSLLNSGGLTTFSSGNSSELYNYYSKEEVEGRIESIKNQYTGRDAAVNCALGVMQMAAQVGKKLNLGWGGFDGETHDEVIVGSNYNSFTSWAINQGSNVNNISLTGILDAGRNTSYEDAQKGDVLVNSAGNMVMIVDNDTNQQEFLVAEVTDPTEGVVVQAKSYASLTGSYQAMDLSSIYNN